LTGANDVGAPGSPIGLPSGSITGNSLWLVRQQRLDTLPRRGHRGTSVANCSSIMAVADRNAADIDRNATLGLGGADQ